MRWICEQSVGFDLYVIDTNNVQESLKEIYKASHYLNKLCKLTGNSEFIMIEYDWGFRTYINGKPTENFIKKYFLNKKNQYEKYN